MVPLEGTQAFLLGAASLSAKSAGSPRSTCCIRQGDFDRLGIRALSRRSHLARCVDAIHDADVGMSFVRLDGEIAGLRQDAIGRAAPA